MASGEGSLFVGLMFLGMGIGLLVGRADAGLMIGLGAGFLAMALWRRRSGPGTASDG